MTKQIDQRRKLPSVATLMANVQAGMTVPEIAKLYSCGETAVRMAFARNGISLIDLRNWKKTRADLFSVKQSQMLEAITPEKMQAASVRDLTGSIVGLHNIERLERGQSTQNIDIQEVTSQLADLTAAENALRAKLGKPLIPTDGDPGDPGDEQPDGSGGEDLARKQHTT
jgi:hypothetical protein